MVNKVGYHSHQCLRSIPEFVDTTFWSNDGSCPTPSVPASVLASVLVQFGSLGWLLVAAVVVDYLFLSLSNSLMHVFFS